MFDGRHKSADTQERRSRFYGVKERITYGKTG